MRVMKTAKSALYWVLVLALGVSMALPLFLNQLAALFGFAPPIT